MRVTDAEARKLGIETQLQARGTLRDPGMNRTEAAYAAHLETAKAAGEVLWWAYEPVSLRLADRTRYVPDFLVLYSDLTLACVEVKGRAGKKFTAHAGHAFYHEDDSWAKTKIAAGMFPLRFRVVWPRKGGGWDALDVA